MGERIFFLETVLLIFLSCLLRGWIRVSLTKLAVFLLAALSFFMIVENAKLLILSDTQTGDFFEDFSLISRALIERFLAYYGDPSAKLQFVLAEGAYFSDALWLKESVGRYLSQLGLAVDFPSGVNGRYWESGYGGPILTNPGGFTTMLLDFGPLAWLPVLLLLIALFLGYKQMSSRSAGGAIAYMMLFLAAVEMPRVPYFYWSRFWLPLALLLVAWAVVPGPARFATERRIS
jgi:hypothetical protein